MAERNSKVKVQTLKNDLIFKRVYGSDNEESKFILKSLLNKILERDENPIVDITYKNPFQIQEYKDDKGTILDIKLEADLLYPDLELYEGAYADLDDEEAYKRKKLIDVEMQIIWHKDMEKRLLAYHGGIMRESLQGSEDYGKMKSTITICITNAIINKDSDDFISKYYFMEAKTHSIFSKMTSIICVELPKVNPDKKPLDQLTPLEICLEYLKYADENGSDYVDELIRRGGKDLEMAQNIFKKATQDEILRERAIAREKYLMDEANRKAREEYLVRKEKNVEQKSEDLARKEKIVEQKSEDLARKERLFAEIEQNLDSRKRAVEQKEESVIQREESVVQREESVVRREESVVQKEESVEQREVAVEQQEQALAQQEWALTQQEHVLARQEQALKQQEKANKKKMEMLKAEKFELVKKLRTLGMDDASISESLNLDLETIKNI